MSDGGHCLRCARNAWQKLGNMNPEEAMEQYITLLSDKIPGWMEASVSGNVEPGPPEAENPGGLASDLSNKSSSHDPVVIMEGNLQVMPGVEKIDVTGGPNLDSRAKE